MRVIAIVGPSCSGKTTVSALLSKHLKCPVIELDHFFKLNAPKIYVEKDGKQIRTFERPELYDANQAGTIIEQLKTGASASATLTDWERKINYQHTILPTKTIIVEGFLTYHYPDVVKHITKGFFIDVPTQHIIERRKKRNREDIENTYDFSSIFEDEWNTYGVPQKQYCTIVDGTQTPQQITQEIVQHLND